MTVTLGLESLSKMGAPVMEESTAVKLAEKALLRLENSTSTEVAESSLPAVFIPVAPVAIED